MSARTRKANAGEAAPADPSRPILLDGTTLTRAQVVAVARQGARVGLDAAAVRRVSRCAAFLDRKLRSGEALYGITTGFGSNADRLLGDARGRPHPDGSDRPLVEELQRNLIISHAVGVGAPLPEDIVRAMLLIRINTLLRGHSGVRTGTVRLMVELLNRRITPLVPEKGSVGASGDLAPLAHLALPLLGEGDVFVAGRQLSAAEALAQAGLAPIALGPKEGLALTNGTAQMLATAVLVLEDMDALLRMADVNAALAVEAFCGRSAAFDARAHALRPHPGQVCTAANVRALLAGSTLVDIAFHRVPRCTAWTPGAWAGTDGQERTFDIRWDYVLPAERHGPPHYYQRHLPFRGGKKAQPQDAYSLRCVPQVHGAVKDAWNAACRVIEIELNAVTDNPLIFPHAPRAEDEGMIDEDGASVLSAGNFHGMPLALAMSHVKTSVPVLASIAERRIAKLVDAATSDGLPPFLIGNEDGTDSGMMIVQYSAAALVNDLASRAHPACVYSVPTSANTEDHVSMGTNEIRQLHDMLPDLRRVLALELVSHCQALEYRLQVLAAAHATATLGTQALRRRIRNLSPVKAEDAALLAADIKSLQEDLRALGQTGPGPVAQRVLQTVREAGIAFMARDRLLKPDLDRAERLLTEGTVLQAAEAVLGARLQVS